MALYRIDGRGPHYDDLRAGTIASMLANINRDPKAQPEAWGALDFIYWNECHHGRQAATAVLLDDPEQQSRLIDSMMFPQKA
jgi:hypothetical protein